MNEPRAMPKAFFKNRPDMEGVSEGDYSAMCVSNPIVHKWLTDALAYLFKEVPALGGIFSITGSENLTTCVSHDKFDGNTFIEIRPISDLTLKATAGTEILHNFQGTYMPASTYQGGIDGGVASTYDYTGTRSLFEGLANYMKTFNKVHGKCLSAS